MPRSLRFWALAAIPSRRLGDLRQLAAIKPQKITSAARVDGDIPGSAVRMRVHVGITGRAPDVAVQLARVDGRWRYPRPRSVGAAQRHDVSEITPWYQHATTLPAVIDGEAVVQKRSYQRRRTHGARALRRDGREWPDTVVSWCVDEVKGATVMAIKVPAPFEQFHRRAAIPTIHRTTLSACCRR